MESNQTLSIRSATAADAAALLDIYEHYVLNTAITFEYEVPSLAEFENRIRTTLERYPYLVAEADGEIIGYAYASAFGSRAAFAWSVETAIYVSRHAHKRGVGKALYAALENALEAMGVRNLYARVCTPAEDPDPYVDRNSEAFHEHLGYRTVGVLNRCGCKFGRWYNLAYMEKTFGAYEPNPAPPAPTIS